MSRRAFTALCIAAVTGPAIGCTPVVHGTAKGYPDRTVEMIIPFSAGGPTDIVGRIVADGLARSLGEDGENAEVAVVNRTGAGGAVGTVEVMNSNPDGYTLTVVTGTAYGTQPHFESTPYGPNDLTAIAEVTALPNVLVVNSDSKIKTFQDFVKAANASEDGLTYGTTGVGSLAHVNFAALSGEAGAKTSDVPFEGNAPAINALLGNNIDSAVIQTIDAVPNIASGEFRPLVIIGSHKPDEPEFEGVPLSTDLGHSIDNDLYFGVAGPPDMETDLRKKIEGAVKQALKDPDVIKRFEELKMSPAFKTGEEFQADIDAMGDVVEIANEHNGGPLK